MLALLGALGSGFVSFLPADPAWGSRLALAPAFGLAVGAALTTTLFGLMSMGVATWVVVVPVIVVSVVVAVIRLRRQRVRLRGGTLGQLAAVVALVLVVATAFNLPMALRNSLGPVAYQVYDAPGYGVQGYEYSKHSMGDLKPFSKFDKGPDLTIRYAAFQVALNQQIGYDTVTSTANTIFGWRFMSTQGGYMIALILVGALGVFAAVRAFTARLGLWPAMVGGALLAGPFFFQLWMDGSQGALSGLALLPPVAVGGYRSLATRRIREVVLWALLLAGFQTAYPYFVPPLVAGAIAVIAVILWRASRSSGIQRIGLARGALVLGGVIVVALALSPVATARTATYWHDILKTHFAISAGLPQFHLPVSVLPSYVLQTQEFYFLPPVLHSGIQHAATMGLAPLGLLVVIGFGMWRFPWTLILLPVAAAAALLAIYYQQKYNCSYCVQRSLLPVAPLGAVAVGVGLGALWSMRQRWLRILSVVAGVCTVLVVGHLASVEIRRANDGAAMSPHQLRALLPAVHKVRGPIYFEAIGQTFQAPLDMPVTYHTVNEVSAQRMAISTEANDFNGLAYLGGARPTGKEYTPNFDWVLTRIPSVRTDRQVVARDGPFALERRRSPFDITVTSGVVVDGEQYDSQGIPWVFAPLDFWVSAESSRPAWALVSFQGPAAPTVRLARSRGAKIVSRSASSLSVCIPTRSRAALRRLVLRLFIPNDAIQAPRSSFSHTPVPPKALRLSAMRVTTTDCTR